MTDPSRGWDRRFAVQGWPAEPDPLLTELVAPLPAGRALDIGSGPGRNSLWLAARGWHVTALGASAVALAQAAQRAATLGVQLATVQADARRWTPPPNSFDLIVITNLHPGADQLTGLLTRVSRTPEDQGAETPRDIAVLAWATRCEAMPSGRDGTTAKKR